MRETRGWLRVVAAAYAAGVDTWTDGSVTVRRVTGGFNNALYQVGADGQSYACKLCVADECRRAAREYAALRLLHEAGLDIAPQPLWLDDSCTIVPFPAVAYHWLPGKPLSPSPTAQQLASLLDSFQRLHAIVEQVANLSYGNHDIPDAWAHWFDFELYLAELGDFLSKYGSWLATANPDGQDLRDRLARLVDSCEEVVLTTDVNPGRESVPLRLCRVDPNLANTVWGGDGQLRWVDWEFSGWGDPALDLAELRWHAASVEMSETQHAWLRDNYRRPVCDHGFEERLAVWDHLRATRWPFLILRWLWSEHHGPDRVRLTRPAADVAELRARLVRFIERAESFASSKGRVGK